MWQEALQIFLQNFTPSISLKESTHQYSTTEIATILEQHTGTVINMEELCIALKERGFTYAKTGEKMLEWLMSACPLH